VAEVLAFLVGLVGVGFLAAAAVAVARYWFKK
jgi:hypothetical protein